MKILIRCDASEKVGHGHAMRCLALAEAMIINGHKPIFLMANTTEFFERQLSKHNIRLIKISTVTGSAGDIGLIIHQADMRDIKNIVIDSYEFDENYIEKLQDENLNVIQIKDDAPIMYRQEVWEQWEKPFKVRVVKNVFIRTEEQIEALCREVAEDLGFNIISPGGEDIVRNMRKSDIAISGAGVTCRELAVVGVPMALVVLSNDQIPNNRYMCSSGAAISLGRAECLDKLRISEAIQTLAASSNKRRSMSYSAKGTIEDNGTEYYMKMIM